MRKGINLLKITVFSLVVLLTAVIANWILNTKARSYIRTDEPEAVGSEVLFFGTSQGQTAVNPCLLWEETGIESYNFSSGGQYIGTTYYAMKDVLNRIKPQYVILDYESLVRPEEFLTVGNRLSNLPMIADLSIRFEMYGDIIAEEPIYLVPLFRYHNRWKELGIGDAKEVETILGSISSTGIWNSTELPGVAESVEPKPVGQREWHYMEQILRLVEAVPDCQLILLDVPGMSYEEESPINDWVANWAEETGILLCPGNSQEARKEMGLTYEDFADHRHLNYTGQKKFTSWLGQWLLEKEITAEDRGDGWAADRKKAKSLMADYEIKYQKTPQALLELLPGSGQTVVLTISTDPAEKSEALWQAVSPLGISRESYEAGGIFLRVRDGSFLHLGGAYGPFRKTVPVGLSDLTVRGVRNPGDSGFDILQAELCLGAETVSSTDAGNHIWVYSGYGEQILRSAQIIAGEELSFP